MSKNSTLNQASQSNSFIDNIMLYVRNWYLFVISLAVCIAGAWLYVKYATPVYKITSTLQIPDDKKEGGLLKETAFSDLNMFKQTKEVDNEIEVLRSRDLIYQVLKKLNLDVSYYDYNAFQKPELYGKSLPFKVYLLKVDKKGYLKNLQLQAMTANKFILKDGEKKWIYNYGQKVQHAHFSIIVQHGPAFADGPSVVAIKFKDLFASASAYSAVKLIINPVIKESNTLVLNLNDAIPQRGVDILTELISIYNAENVRRKNLMALNTIMFIDKRLKTMRQDFSTAEGVIENYKQQNKIVDVNAGAQLNLTKSAEYSQMLDASEVQLSIVRSIDAYFSNPKNQFSMMPSTMGLKDPVLITLIGRFNDLQMERNKMLRTANLSNPLVQNVSEQLANLRVNIKENLNNLKKGITIERDNLRQNTVNYNSKIQMAPALETGLMQRSREQGVKNNLYQYLLQKREETALSLSATIPTSVLIDKPAYNPVPEFPKPPFTYLCACFLGLLLPASFVYIRHNVNFKVKDSSAIMNISGVRVLGELSHNDVKSQIVIKKGTRSTISELFRYIRSNLGVLNPDIPNKVLLVTSTMKGEGKTFFCINLGLTLSLLNKKVLLLEFDLRKPDLVKKMGLSETKGISDYLQGDTDDLMGLIQPYQNSEHMYVLGCGTFPDNPAELLLESRMEKLFETLRNEFDYLVIDTSPVGQVADAFSLDKHADLSIYVVRYNYTSTQQLSILQDIYQHEKLKNLMVVFNDARRENQYAYGYGAYGYAAGK